MSFVTQRLRRYRAAKKEVEANLRGITFHLMIFLANKITKECRKSFLIVKLKNYKRVWSEKMKMLNHFSKRELDRTAKLAGIICRVKEKCLCRRY